MKPGEMAARLDQTLVRPDARQSDFEHACDQAILFRFRGLCVPCGVVHRVKKRLDGSGVLVVAAVAFPHGTSAGETKAFEVTRAVADGADEIDYVITLRAAFDGDLEFLRAEADAVMAAAGGRRVKAILELGLLPDDNAFAAARTLAQQGVAYVKTSTGFGPRGATVEDVKLLAEAVRGVGKTKVKASGGVRTKERALELLQAGASVVGTSQGPTICS